MICGHFSREELDAASLANTVCLLSFNRSLPFSLFICVFIIKVINVLGLCIDMGFSTASETLFSQVI